MGSNCVLPLIKNNKASLVTSLEFSGFSRDMEGCSKYSNRLGQYRTRSYRPKNPYVALTFWGLYGTMRYQVARRLTDSKSVCAKAHEGSNPSLSAKFAALSALSRKGILAAFTFTRR